jgi:epoxyqueuosine reductase
MSSELSNKIKAEALRLGFFACGIAKAEPVDVATQRQMHEWLDVGGHADMAYMLNHEDKRLNPLLLMNGVKSIVCVALNYAPSKHFPEGEYKIAAYALGQDYHTIVKEKLHLLGKAIGLCSDDYRAFCDSAPVLERYWAVKAGLGWIGRNHQLIIPHAGSMFFLGELFIKEETDYDKPMENRCGDCHKCIDACPTKVLGMDPFCAEHCLSYQLIENRKELSDEAKNTMGDTIYGCDRCQQACPWNRFASPSSEPQLQPKEELLNMTRTKWEQLSEEDYRKLFKGSAVKRAKYEGLIRNIKAAAEKDSVSPARREGTDRKA